MTDHLPSDELISAHLDDEATPDEAAAVEASASARARRDELEAVRALVGQPVVPPPEARDAAVAAALAVFDREIAAPAASDRPDVGAPTPLTGRRVRRRSPLVAVLGAAASIVFLLAVGVISLSQRGSHPEYTSAGPAAENQSADQGVAAPGAPPAPSAASGGGSEKNDLARTRQSGEDAFTAPVDLGVVAGAAELRQRVATQLASAPVAPTVSAPPEAVAALDVAPQSCEAAQRAADPGLGPLVLAGRATYQGKPAVVLAYRAQSNGPVRAIVAEPGSCRILLVDPG